MPSSHLNSRVNHTNSQTKKKDLFLLDNWRPISLLNNDDKVFALIFAKRLKSVLDSIIEETQSGFMRNRHITNNIRLVLYILDYPEFNVENGFILFLDFCKAFDSVEHQFIFESLIKFGFGNFFTNATVQLSCWVALLVDFICLEGLDRVALLLHIYF